MWSQKAQKNWDINRDRNTKIFQAVVKTRCRRNRIIQIRNDEDNWISDLEDIQQCFLDHYTQLFTEPQNHSVNHIQEQISSLPITTLTEQQISHLDQPILDEEIYHAVTQLGSLKTPGPDGIPAAFYQKYRNIVKHDICQMVKAFFHSSFFFFFFT
jgi:hypothetical protein